MLGGVVASPRSRDNDSSVRLNDIEMCSVKGRIQPFSGRVQNAARHKAVRCRIKPVDETAAHAAPAILCDRPVRQLNDFGIRAGKAKTGLCVDVASV